MSAPVPQDWTEMIGHVSAAQVAELAMQDKALPEAGRIAHRIKFDQEKEAIYLCLSRLRESRDLARITLLLARKERA